MQVKQGRPSRARLAACPQSALRPVAQCATHIRDLVLWSGRKQPQGQFMAQQ